MRRERRYLKAPQVRERYGDISDMTLWRWLNSPALGFPQPFYIGRYRYFNEEDLDEFDARQAKGAK